MLVVKPRGGGKKRYRYGGSGIFDTLSRKLFSSGLKTAISTAAKSAIAQKVANAVVNGASSATQKAVEGAVNEAINKVKPYVLGKKRPATAVSSSSSSSHQPSSLPTPTVAEGKEVKRRKININSLISGSGIVFD